MNYLLLSFIMVLNGRILPVKPQIWTVIVVEKETREGRRQEAVAATKEKAVAVSTMVIGREKANINGGVTVIGKRDLI